MEDTSCKFCWKKYLFFVKKYDDTLDFLYNQVLDSQSVKKSGGLKHVVSQNDMSKLVRDNHNSVKTFINYSERKNEKKQRSSSIGAHGSRKTRNKGLLRN